MTPLLEAVLAKLKRVKGSQDGTDGSGRTWHGRSGG
jgi:hypothetical protein